MNLHVDFHGIGIYIKDYSRAASSDTLTLGTNAPKQSVRILAMEFKMQGSLASSSSEVSTTVKEQPDKHDQANSNLQSSA